MRILLATDGREAAEGAARLAGALVRSARAEIEVLSVIEPVPIYGGSVAEMVAFTQVELQGPGVEKVRERVREHLGEILPAMELSIHTEIGQAPSTIVDIAEQLGAEMIVLGMGRHERSDRWFGTETALKVARLSHVPVIAVPADVRDQPRIPLVATDFSEFSRYAAIGASHVSASGAPLHLVHVLWEPSSDSPWMPTGDWIEKQKETVSEALADWKRMLEEETGRHVETHLLSGVPIIQIFELADQLQADLIALGTHGAGFLNRILLGSVSTRVLRGAKCSVLIAPPPSKPSG